MTDPEHTNALLAAAVAADAQNRTLSPLDAIKLEIRAAVDAGDWDRAGTLKTQKLLMETNPATVAAEAAKAPAEGTPAHEAMRLQAEANKARFEAGQAAADSTVAKSEGRLSDMEALQAKAKERAADAERLQDEASAIKTQSLLDAEAEREAKAVAAARAEIGFSDEQVAEFVARRQELEEKLRYPDEGLGLREQDELARLRALQLYERQLVAQKVEASRMQSVLGMPGEAIAE